MAKKEKVVEETKNEPKGDVTKVQAKMKSDPVDLEKTNITKVNLDKPIKPEDNETKKDNADNSGVVAEPENAEPTQEQKEIQPEAETQEEKVLEEVVNTEDKIEEKVEEVKEQVEEAIAKTEATGEPLPESVQKLVEFMNDTGGDLNDYVKLNQDYSKLDNQDLLFEYYKQTKPHLNNEEINFMMEDQFSYDENDNTETEIRRKKLALKEQVANARNHLDGLKSKYYEEIKSGSKLTSEQQEAIDFYNKSQEKIKQQKKESTDFLNRTNRFFGDQFKGFEYNVGEKSFRFNVSDKERVKQNQSNINNFTKKFLDKNNNMVDEAGYHKSLFTANNADAIAKHFYEQGRADALKDSIAKSKNINMDPRQELTNNFDSGGFKVKVLGDNSSDFKFKIKNKR
tara:strand:+ start:866 stop:2059 length:1194 start_codon:yes stop_codon:yes gene_type:complete